MKISNYVHVATAVDQGWIPNFLFTIWSGKHGGNPVKDYKKELRLTPMDIGFLGFMIALVGLIFLFMSSDKTQPPIVDKIVAIIGGSLLGIGIIAALLSFARGEPEKKNGHQCYMAIAALFAYFDAEASPNVAKLSKEEFRRLIEDALAKKAQAVDNADGFNKIKIREEFNQMHATALKWDLCHENHAKYFPEKKKDTVTK